MGGHIPVGRLLVRPNVTSLPPRDVVDYSPGVVWVRLDRPAIPFDEPPERQGM